MMTYTGTANKFWSGYVVIDGNEPTRDAGNLGQTIMSSIFIETIIAPWKQHVMAKIKIGDDNEMRTQ